MAKDETEKTVEQKVEHKNIYAALSAFQGELKPIEKTANVSYTTKANDVIDFNYAPLGGIMEVLYPLLAKHGLSVRWELMDKATGDAQADLKNNVRKTLECILMHESGETTLTSGKLEIDTLKGEMKEVGGQLTYGRRYTVGLLLGLSSEDDKDTQLFDQSQKNVIGFAFKQVQTTIDKAKVGEELDKQITFLEKELVLAEELEAGKGTKAPSLGLKAEQYKKLLELANAKKSGDTTLHPIKENGA